MGSEVPTLVDVESYRNSWPRHYNIVNFIFNYGVGYPELADKFGDMIQKYGQSVGVDPRQAAADFNISAAIRSLQMIEERLIGGGFDLRVAGYIETAMKKILNNQLFNERN